MWIADLTTSRLLAPAPTEVLVVIVHAEPDVNVEMTITVVGKWDQVTFAVRTNGTDTDNFVLGAPWRSRALWIGPDLLIESWVQQPGRESHLRDFWSLSADGRTLTMEHRDDDLRGQITVPTRSGVN